MGDEPFAMSYRRGHGSRSVDCRYDHAYASAADFDLDKSSCSYRGDLLAAGVSDHAPAVALLRCR